MTRRLWLHENQQVGFRDSDEVSNNNKDSRVGGETEVHTK